MCEKLFFLKNYIDYSFKTAKVNFSYFQDCVLFGTYIYVVTTSQEASNIQGHQTPKASFPPWTIGRAVQKPHFTPEMLPEKLIRITG